MASRTHFIAAPTIVVLKLNLLTIGMQKNIPVAETLSIWIMRFQIFTPLANA
jgi:phosphoserine aminotransferase